MTEQLRISMAERDVGAALAVLARGVGPNAVRLIGARELGTGELVRFHVSLADGSEVWQGLGRCRSCEPGDASGSFEVELAELSFDARNEILYERIQMMGDGRATGAFEAVEMSDRVPSIAPPSSVSAPELESREPSPSPPPSAPQRPSPPRAALHPVAATPARLSAPTVEGERTIAVPADLLQRAEVLARQLRLKAPSLTRGRWDEDRVLEAALRMGFDALDRLTLFRDE